MCVIFSSPPWDWITSISRPQPRSVTITRNTQESTPTRHAAKGAAGRAGGCNLVRFRCAAGSCLGGTLLSSTKAKGIFHRPKCDTRDAPI